VRGTLFKLATILTSLHVINSLSPFPHLLPNVDQVSTLLIELGDYMNIKGRSANNGSCFLKGRVCNTLCPSRSIDDRAASLVCTGALSTADGTGIVENASPEVLQKFRYVICIHVSITVQVTHTGIFSGAGIVELVSAEVL